MSEGRGRKEGKEQLLHVGHPPALYKKKHRVVHKHELDLIRQISNPSLRQRGAFVDPPLFLSKNKSSISSPQKSIDQIKVKIKQYISNHNNTSALYGYSSDPIKQKMEKQYYVSIFKKNAKRRVNLKILDQIDHESNKNQKLNKDVNISQAYINPRNQVNDPQQFMKRQHRGRITDLKNFYNRKNLSGVKKEKEKQKNGEGRNKLPQLRHSGIREWDSRVEPWWRDEDYDLPTV